jgi:hypothetical protein
MVAARAHAQMEVGAARGFGVARVHDHDRAVAVLRQRLQGVDGIAAAMRHARVRPEDEHVVGVRLVGLEHGCGRGLQHPLVEQAVLGLLLGERVEPALRADRFEEAHRVRRIHVVALSADSDQADGAWRVALADGS